MKNKLNRLDVICLVIGSIIGYGSFSLPGKQFLPKSGVIDTTIGLLAGGCMILFIQKAYHIMMEQSDKEGGEFAYTYDHLGKKHGFVVGWFLSMCYLSMVPLNASAFVLVFHQATASRFRFGYMYSIASVPVYFSDTVLMCIVLLIFAIVNTKGLYFSTRIQNVMTILLVSIVLALAFLVGSAKGGIDFQAVYISGRAISPSEIFSVIAIVPFLFVGFDVIPQVASELGFQRKKASALAIVSIAIGVALYALLNLIAAFRMTPAMAQKAAWALGEAVQGTLGNIGFFFLLIALFAAVIGGINGFYIASAKLLAGMAAYDMLPRKFADVNRAGVHDKAVRFIFLIGLGAAWLGRDVILYIIDMASFLAAAAYAYVSLISFLLSRKKTDRLLCLLAVMVSVFFMLLLIFPASPGRLKLPSLLLLIGWCLAGIFTYKRMHILRMNSKK